MDRTETGCAESGALIIRDPERPFAARQPVFAGQRAEPLQPRAAGPAERRPDGCCSGGKPARAYLRDNPSPFERWVSGPARQRAGQGPAYPSSTRRTATWTQLPRGPLSCASPSLRLNPPAPQGLAGSLPGRRGLLARRSAHAPRKRPPAATHCRPMDRPCRLCLPPRPGRSLVLTQSVDGEAARRSSTGKPWPCATWRPLATDQTHRNDRRQIPAGPSRQRALLAHAHTLDSVSRCIIRCRL